MSNTAIISVLIGVLIIVGRGPLIFWPEATREFYLKLIATNLRVRLIGVCLLALGIVMIMSARADARGASIIIQGLGWFLVFIAFFGELIFASIVRLIAEAVLEALDNVMLRGLGVLAVGLGAFFIWLGLKVLS
jgi:uncharacterized protein YjeT (DUF2065 family)